MGDARNGDLRFGVDRRLKLKSLGSKATTDAGLLAYRELDETLGLAEVAQDSLQDSRVLAELVRSGPRPHETAQAAATGPLMGAER